MNTSNLSYRGRHRHSTPGFLLVARILSLVNLMLLKRNRIPSWAIPGYLNVCTIPICRKSATLRILSLMKWLPRRKFDVIRKWPKPCHSQTLIWGFDQISHNNFNRYLKERGTSAGQLSTSPDHVFGKIYRYGLMHIPAIQDDFQPSVINELMSRICKMGGKHNIVFFKFTFAKWHQYPALPPFIWS